MKGRLLLLVMAQCGLWSLPARANPVSLDVLRARQVPQTMHVQITLGADDSAAPEPLSVTRDGQPLTVDWSDATSFTANTGSGLKSTTATQFCDCDVAAGEHSYVVKFNSSFSTDPEERARSVTVRENLPNPDAGLDGGGADMHPWEIPEPSEIQGLDCVAACADTTPDAAGPVPDAAVVPDAGSSNLDGPVMPERDSGSTNQLPADQDDGGCALVGLDRAGSLLLLAGLALIALRRRHR